MKSFHRLLLLFVFVGACFGKNSGDCKVTADCPGSTCVELTQGGFRSCKLVFEEALFCQDLVNGTDECCTTADCQVGACFDSQQAQPVCLGVPPIPHNVCGVDDCAQDSDCGAGFICSLPGTFESALRHCIPTSCSTDDDCQEEKDGSCAPIEEGCCGLTVTLACAYPSDGCRSDGDCGVDNICEVVDGRARCIVDQRVCPA